MSSLKPKASTVSPIQTVRSRITNVRSTESQIRDINAQNAGGDESLLAEIGYKQELKRTFSTFQVFGIAYSIMGLLPSISSVAATGYASGSAGFLWSWFVSVVFILSIGISMAELASAIPTSGGLYYWTFYYAPEGRRVLISFIVGICNSVALCASVVSIAYGNAEEILAAVYISKEGSFDITTGKTYGVFAACVLSQVICTCVSSKNVAALQSVSAIANTGLIVLFLIALPIGTSKNIGSFNDGKFIFGTVTDMSTWPTGWQFLLSMMSAVWTIMAFDSCVHMSEEAKNASYGVPIGIISAICVCGIVGFFIIVCMNACVYPSVESILDSDTGFPMAQMVYNSMGKNWAVAIMSLMAACQWLMGASIVTAASRQIWAFARDNGLPFASVVKVVNKKLKVPIRAVIFAGILSLLLGLLCLAGSTCANALFSFNVAADYFAWITPIFLRLTTGKSKFRPGAFYLGPTLSAINSWITVIWGCFIILICMFPSDKSVEPDTMNYCVVMLCGTWILSIIFFYTYKYKHFHGPSSNISPEEALEIEEKVKTVDSTPIGKGKDESDSKLV